MNMIIKFINIILWDSKILMILLLGTGIWFTIQLKFIQLKGLKEGIKLTFKDIFSKKNYNTNRVSSFKSLTTAIAAQVGTGNLSGAATAIAIGGPGSIFWMWISAFFGMATIYSETLMAQKYKKILDKYTVTGGPVYYIKAAYRGKLGKFFAIIFAIFIILALGFMGNAVQSNSVSMAFNKAFGVNQIVTGSVLAILSFFVFSGGINRIMKATVSIVPIMALFYIIGSLIVILVNYKNIILAFQEIFIGAFFPRAIAGGVIGATFQKAIGKGISRGLFSNEAGMGSTPHAHAIAKVNHPSQQGFVAMIGVFIDTFIILNLTALVILTTRSVTPDGSVIGTELTQLGFSYVFGDFGNIFIAVCMFFFSFSTIIGWYFFGRANIQYLFGKKFIKIYSAIVCFCVLLGAFGEVDIIWDASDMFNGLMIIPNLLSLLALTKEIKKLNKGYFIKNFNL